MVSGNWTSGVPGPIPPHPYYDSRPQSDYVEKVAGRTKPEAKDIADHGTKGTVGLVLQLQGTQIGPRPKFKPPPKDHISDNVRRMRRIQRISRQQQKKQEEELPKPVKALWKSEKYSNVPSKVVDHINRDPDTPRPASANFLRAHSRSGSPMRPAAGGFTPRLRIQSADKLNVPTAASAKDVKMFRQETDFIKINGQSAKFHNMKRAPSLSALDDLKKKQNEDERYYKKGIVPKYLIQRRKEMADEYEQRIADTPDPSIPEGHKVMSEKERSETLELLRKNQETLITQLNVLPITSDTMRVKTKRHELEVKLEEIEEAIKIFSRPKVFVKIDQ